MSIDEAYFDLSFSGSYQKVVDISKIIKKEIKEKENLTASIGIGPNKLVAKIESDMQKPNGLTVVGAYAEKTSTELVEAFLAPLPIRKIPGIGQKTERQFLAIEFRKIEDLRKLSRQELESLKGKWGSELYEKIWGRDESPILESYEIKSIGRQETFLYDTRILNFVVKRLEIMCEDFIKNFKEEGFTSFRTVALTVRFADFETKTRSYTLDSPANSLVVLRH